MAAILNASPSVGNIIQPCHAQPFDPLRHLAARRQRICASEYHHSFKEESSSIPRLRAIFSSGYNVTCTLLRTNPLSVLTNSSSVYLKEKV